VNFGPSSELNQPTAAGSAWLAPGAPDWLSWGFGLYSTYQQGESTRPGGNQPPIRSAFRVSHPLGDFLPPMPARPCFMPGALMRFCPSGSSPPGDPHSSRSRCSHAVSRTIRLHAEAKNRTMRPRLRSLTPARGPFPNRRGLGSDRADTPMGFYPSEAFPPATGALSDTTLGNAPRNKFHGKRNLRHFQPQDWLVLSPTPKGREGGLPAPLGFPTSSPAGSED
jgi:hypothetical protein